MIVYLWDTDGPASSARGVTDDDARALKAAEACLVNGQATAARIRWVPLPGFTGTGGVVTDQVGENGNGAATYDE